MVDSPRIFVGNDLELLAGGLLASYVTGTAIQVNGKPWHPPAKLIAELFGDDWTRPEAKPTDDEVVEPGYRRAVARKVAYCIDAAGEILDRLRLETADIADAIARSSPSANAAEQVDHVTFPEAGDIPGGGPAQRRDPFSWSGHGQNFLENESSPPASSANAAPDSPGSADNAPAVDELARAATALPSLAQLSGDSAAEDLIQPEKE